MLHEIFRILRINSLFSIFSKVILFKPAWTKFLKVFQYIMPDVLSTTQIILMENITMKIASTFSTLLESRRTSQHLLRYLTFGLIILILMYLFAISKDDVTLPIMTTAKHHRSTVEGLHTYEDLSKQFISDWNSSMRILKNDLTYWQAP